MAELIYDIFKHLTGVPVNFWFWLLLITAPALVFSAKPDHSFCWRVGRLVLAIVLTYGLINLGLHTYRALKWKAYNECQGQFSDGAIQHHEECGEMSITDGASNVFLALFGYIPAAGYVGFWELLWRVRYRKRIRELGNNYKGRWFSNIIIPFFIPLFLYICFIALILVTALVDQYIYSFISP